MLDHVGEFESEVSISATSPNPDGFIIPLSMAPPHLIIDLEQSLTLEISHKRLGARVQRVDDHFAVCRTGDLHTGVSSGVLGDNS